MELAAFIFDKVVRLRLDHAAGTAFKWVQRGAAVRNFIRCFERERQGVWRCKTFATLYLPEGKKVEIAPGTVLVHGSSFMGLDLAKMLDEQDEQDNAPPKIG